MKFSIIIPFYNSSTYISKCIDSTLNQTFEDFEVILIDDGSTDDGYELVKKKYSNDVRIHLYKKNNGGVSSARNYGLDVCSGDWITFLDADDWLDDKYLERAAQILNNETSVDFIMFNLSAEYENCSTVECDQLNSLVADHSVLIENIICYEYSTRKYGGKYGNCRCIGGKIYRRSILNKVRFPDGIKVCEDGIFNLQALTNSRNVFLCSEALYHYYTNNASATHRFNEIKEKQFGIILEQFKRYADYSMYRDSFDYCKFDFYITAIFGIPFIYKFPNVNKETKIIRDLLIEYEIDHELLSNISDEFLMKRKRYIKNKLLKQSYLSVDLIIRITCSLDNLKRKLHR